MKTKFFSINRTLITAIAFGVMTTSAFASSKTINFATGQDSNGNIQLRGGSYDGNWMIIGDNPFLPAPPFNALNPPNSFVVAPVNGGFSPYWFMNGPDSTWISANPNSLDGTVVIYTYTFSLAGDDLRTAAFDNLKWALDDRGTIQLNDHLEASLRWGPGDVFSFICYPH